MSRSGFKNAYGTSFDLLSVDQGQESSDEEVQESPVLESSKGAPVKQTKTALKKAAKAAREEKKRKRAGASPSSTPDTGSSPAPPQPAQLPPTPPPEFTDLPPPVPKSNEGPKAIPAPTNGNGNAPAASSSTPKEKVAPHAPAPVAPRSPPIDENAMPLPLTSPLTVPTVVSEKPTNGSVVPAEPEAAPPATKDAEKSKKLMSIFTRTLWTFIMIGGFVACLLLGHVYMIILVMVCQMLVYREVTRLFMLTDPKTSHSERDVWSKTLNWYFFAVANYFLYGESIIYYFKHVVFAEASLLPFATNHRIISFSLYTIGFMGFVMSLQKGHLQQQFGLFCWVHMSLLLVVVSSHFIVNNILEGLIWFWVPASLVICNDIFAYIWGMSIGRTPLIKLSPKKTVEGFLGAFVTTIFFAILWGTYFSKFNYMICPVHDLGVSAWSKMQCEANSTFVWREWQIWLPVASFLSALVPGEIKSIWFMPYQIHLFWMACFASLVAPFGGFFASGFKRAFNIKDFGHSIPGHGGMTDRMDCQFLMGVFTYVYYSNLIREHHVTVGTVLQTIVSGLTTEEQFELMRDLKHYLEGQGLVVKL